MKGSASYWKEATFLPGVLEPGTLEASLLCILDVPDREALKLRVLSPTHSRRSLSDAQLGTPWFDSRRESWGLAPCPTGSLLVINENLSNAVRQIRTLVDR